MQFMVYNFNKHFGWGGNLSEFGKYLKELRGKRSLREMERITGLSHTYLSTLEKGFDPRSGKERKPTPETLKKLSDTLEVSYEKLLEVAGYIKTFGGVISELRKNRGWSLEQLEQNTINFEYGEPIFINKTTLSKFENGEIKNPSVYEIYLLAYAFGVPLETFYNTGITTPEKDLETFLFPGKKPDPLSFLENIINMLLDQYFSEDTTYTEKQDLKSRIKAFESEINRYADLLNKLSLTGNKLITIPPIELDEDIEHSLKQNEITHLLSSTNNLNFNGKKLTPNDINKIIEVIKNMEDEFEFLD